MGLNIMNDLKQNVIETSDGNPFQALSYDLINNCSTKSTLSILARNKQSGDTYSSEYKFAANRVSGSAILIGEIVTSMTPQFYQSMKNINVSIGTSGTALNVSVNGITGAIIDWVIILQILIMQDSGGLFNRLRKLINIK